MYNLYYNLVEFIKYDSRRFIRRLLGRDKIDMEECAELLSPEQKAEIDISVSEYCNNVPSLNPERTALFTTLADVSDINYFNERRFCRKIRLDFKVLFRRGYDTFFVNYGNRYGTVAMQELLRIKSEGYGFKIYCGKIYGENNSMLRDGLTKTFQIYECDKHFHTLYPMEFLRYVTMCVTAISTEKRLFYSRGKIPHETYDYYKKIEQSMKIKTQTKDLV